MKFQQGRRPVGRNSQSVSRRAGKEGQWPAKPPRSALPEGVFVVEGIAAVQEYLRYSPASVVKVFVKEASAKIVKNTLKDFKFELEVIGGSGEESVHATPVWAYVKHELGAWTDFLSELEEDDSELLNLVLVLDHISDPRNLGAIVRSAAFFGIRHVIVPERRQVLLTQASVNTAQGGFALTKLTVVVNVSRALEELKSRDFWVLGAAMSGEPVARVSGRYDKQVLVLGSEDKGISPGVLSHCDVVVSIAGAEKSLDSLNVSVAAGILIHELRRST